LPPTFEKAATDWQTSRQGRVAPSTVTIGRVSLTHLLPAFGPRLLCDITLEDINGYQSKRRQSGAEGRTVNIEVGVLRQVMGTFWPDGVHMLPERKDIGKALSLDEEIRLLEATAARTDSACHTATVLALNTTMSKKEICNLKWGLVDLEHRVLTVGKAKNEFRTGRAIPLNAAAFETLVKWAGRFPNAEPDHYVFPFSKSGVIDPTRPAQGWRSAWEEARKRAGVKVRFHDLRVTCITKMAESQASDQTIMAIAGHVSRRMLEHYSRIRMDAKRVALDAIARQPQLPIFETAVHQNCNQVTEGQSGQSSKLLN
jgi:integrase